MTKLRKPVAKTGFVRVEKIEGVWWFVSPTGEPFLSLGVNHIEPHLWMADIYPKSCTSRYCVKLTSSGKCEIIEIAQRRQIWQSDTRRKLSFKWSPSY